MDNLRETASALEIIWVLFTLAGVGFYLHALLRAIGDERARQKAGVNGARRILARASIRRNGVCAFFMSLFLLIGIASLLLPPRTETLTGGDETTLAKVLAVFSPLAFVLMVILLVGDSALENRERGQLIAIYERQAAAKAADLEAEALAARAEVIAARVEKIEATTTETNDRVRAMQEGSGP